MGGEGEKKTINLGKRKQVLKFIRYVNKFLKIPYTGRENLSILLLDFSVPLLFWAR